MRAGTARSFERETLSSARFIRPAMLPIISAFSTSPRATCSCGDLARLGGTVVIPASAGGSLTDYLASLRRIRALAPHRLLPGHGPPVAEPAVLIDEYLKHRADRERQIVAALRSGRRTLQEIVDEVYENLAEPLVRAARDSVHAHLIKLAAEGRAQEMRDGWELT